MDKISNTNTEAFTFDRTVERESEIISLIESYIKLDNAVEKPLLIHCKYEHSIIEEYVKGIEGGYAYNNTPRNEKTDKLYQKPYNYGSKKTTSTEPLEPKFIYRNSNYYDDDNFWDHSIGFKFVEELRIPFIYFAPIKWMENEGFNNPQGPALFSKFDSVLYVSTIKGWLEDMAEETELPNKKRLKEKSVKAMFAIDLMCPDYGKIEQVAPKLDSLLFAHKYKHLTDFAVSIKDLDCYEDLLHNKPRPVVAYDMEEIMDFYSSVFFIRVLWPNHAEGAINHKILDSFKQDPDIKAFIKYLETTDDAWVFDYSKPVPEDIIQEVQKAKR